MSDRRLATQNARSVARASAAGGGGSPAVVHALLERLATCHGSAVIDVDQAGHALAISDFKRDAMHARRSGVEWSGACASGEEASVLSPAASDGRTRSGRC